MHERAFSTRAIKIRQNEQKNPSKRGKQAKFKAHFAISREASLLWLSPLSLLQ
nr:hypothetical protein [uncultured Campylobacter sp.]